MEDGLEKGESRVRGRGYFKQALKFSYKILSTSLHVWGTANKESFSSSADEQVYEKRKN